MSTVNVSRLINVIIRLNILFCKDDEEHKKEKKYVFH